MCLVFLVILSNISCSEDYEKNAIHPKFEEIDWGIPNSYKLRYFEPLAVHVTPDNRRLICNYMITLENKSASAICIIERASGESKWFTVPYWASVRPLSAKILCVFFGIRASDGEDNSGYFLDIDTLTQSGPAIPYASHLAAKESEFLVLVKRKRHKDEQWREDICLFDLASGTKKFLPASKHGLFSVRLAVSADRLIISGQTDNSFDPIKTQLWRLPELEKISEYESAERIPWGGSYKPLVLGNDSFCFAHAVGLRKVAGLNKGVVRFSVGQLVPEKAWLERLEYDDIGDPIWVLDDTAYVEETGRFVCLESFAKGKKTDIKTYDIVTGKKLHSVKIPYEDLEFVNVAKVAGEWVVLCFWSDPKEDPAPDAQFHGPRKMWFVPYRLKDLAKAMNSIEMVWGGFHEPEIADGKLISVMTDHALIYDLSSIVNFGANQDNKGGHLRPSVDSNSANTEQP
jgi:hypothetical protein